MESPTRVLFIIDGLEGDGAERQFCELVKGVQALQEFEPHVVVLEDNDSGHAWILEDCGISVNVYARRSRFDLSPIPKIVRHIRQHQIQLVHAYMSMGSEFGLIAAKVCRIPIIASSIRNGMNGNWREAIRTFYQSHLADLAVANSRAGFSSRFRTMRDSFRVVHNGFDTTRFDVNSTEKEALKAQLSIPDGSFVVCMAARMEPQKDHRTLLDALHLVSGEVANVQLLLAGQGTLEADTKKHCQALGLDNTVRFLGHQREVEKLLSISDVSVLLTNTDIHLEGISNTIIESMAVGTAVVATGGGGTDEILNESDAGSPPYTYGIKVNAHDPTQVAAALSYYAENPTERAAIADRARSMVLKRFGLKRFVDENVLLYRELLEDDTPQNRAVVS